jgi:uncharacterized OB-fold protein
VHKSAATAIADWTRGERGIRYQHCPACRHVWYVARPFCPRCGAAPPEDRAASGRGTVAACTGGARAPTPAVAAHAPYAVLLVDAAEGFRLMAHGDAALQIGDAVQADYRSFGGTLVPHFIATREEPTR